MSKILTMDEMAKQLAENALDNFLCNGKSLREWMKIIASEDAISRKAVLDKAYAYGNGLEPEGYCVNVEDIQALPPIQPKAKAGKWIVDQDAFSEINGYILKCHCSECNHKKEFYDHKSITTPTLKNASFIDNYCPNCGAKMEVEE